MTTIIKEPIIKRLAEAFLDARKELYLVGGVVRDLLLGRHDSKDIDMCTDATPDEIRKIVATTNPISVTGLGEKFGTILIHYSHFPPVEITTYRSETYTDDSRKPVVTFGVSIYEDLSRRDFTVNAIAMHALTGLLYDPFYGETDLIHHKKIRAVENPAKRFQEDPLRLLRGIRFASQLGFQFEEETLSALNENAWLLGTSKISQERIRDEFNKILMLPGRDASRAMYLLYNTGLLQIFLPEIASLMYVMQFPYHQLDVFGHTMKVVEAVDPDLVLRLAALFHDVGKPQTRSVEEKDGEKITHFYGHEDVGAKMVLEIMARLRYPQEIAKIVSKMVKMHMRFNAYDKDWGNSAVRNLYLDAGDQFLDLIKLSIADTKSDTGTLHSIAEARLVAGLYSRVVNGVMNDIRQNPIMCPVTGDDLMEHFGRGPGSWIRPIKEELMKMVRAGKLAHHEKDRALHLAEKIDKGEPVND